MFIPNTFKNENIEEVKNFLNENSFGILISQENGKPSGTHIPMELDTNEAGEAVLTGHISKANPQSKNIKNNEEVLAIFNGPDSYISSSWYEKENVPTWNYIAVHIYGKVKIIEGKELLLALKKLVNKYEKNSENPVSVSKMSSKTMEQINGIVGFSIKIDEIQASYKLSQNRKDKDYKNIITALEKTNTPNAKNIAIAMKKEHSKKQL